MHTTRIFSFFSWWLIAAGCLLTGYFTLPHTGSMTMAAVMFTPYVLLYFTRRSARRIGPHVFVFFVALLTIYVTFDQAIDARYIHRSTLNFRPLDTAILQSLAIWIIWMGIRHVEKKSSASPRLGG